MNKYNSYVELFTSNAILNEQLDTFATPPADLTLSAIDFTGQDLYPHLDSAGAAAKVDFEINDVPMIRGIGIWCNLADGLVQNDAVDDIDAGLVFRIQWQSYDAMGVLADPDITNPFNIKLLDFNTLYDVNFLFPAVDGLGAFLPGYTTRLHFSYWATASNFSTITIDPSFATKRLIMRPMVLVEHTLPMA